MLLYDGKVTVICSRCDAKEVTDSIQVQDPLNFINEAAVMFDDWWITEITQVCPTCKAKVHEEFRRVERNSL